jgi:hypothetical protein
MRMLQMKCNTQSSYVMVFVQEENSAMVVLLHKAHLATGLLVRHQLQHSRLALNITDYQ